MIGAGSGGVRAARVAAGHGAKVMVAEAFRVGGTCVIRGCVPKKLMVYASRFRDAFEDAAGFGWTVPPTSFDWTALVAAKEREITRLSALYAANLARAGVTLVETRATLAGPNSVRLADGRQVRAAHILIATGATPSLEPRVPGLEHTITSDAIFDLPTFPGRFLIVGGGYIAVEFASVFARLGSAVTLCLRGEKVLRGFDEDMRDGVGGALAEAGVALRPATLPLAVEKTATGLRVRLSAGEDVEVDQVLVATGRRPHTADLGLEAAGVAVDAGGAVKVDVWSRSTAPTVWAVGDVTNRMALTPVAIREGHCFADTVFGGKPSAVVHANIPTAVFTTPEVGTIGLTEEQATAMFDVVDVYRAAFRPMMATVSGREERTVMKIVVDGVTDKVLGVHVFGHEAGEMAQLLGVIVRMGATKADLDATMAVHPTAGEELVTMRARAARHVRQTSPVEPGLAVMDG